ncbi:MAG: serine hydrolase domain-containing protein, partial [Chitinophagaceae bacterium]
MKKSTLHIVLISFLLICQHAKAQTGLYVPELANFDTAMMKLMSQFGIPGGQLAITYQGRLVYNRGFGYADAAAGAFVCPDNIFRIASVSKPITSVTLMRLYQQGRIQLGDTVFGAHGILNDKLYEDIKDRCLVERITVRDLLTHSGGWNPDISGDPMFKSLAIARAMSVASPPDAETIIRYVLSHQMLDFI